VDLLTLSIPSGLFRAFLGGAETLFFSFRPSTCFKLLLATSQMLGKDEELVANVTQGVTLQKPTYCERPNCPRSEPVPAGQALQYIKQQGTNRPLKVCNYCFDYYMSKGDSVVQPTKRVNRTAQYADNTRNNLNSHMQHVQSGLPFDVEGIRNSNRKAQRFGQ